MLPKKTNSPSASNNDKLNKLIDMINDLKSSQSKIITSINSNRESIKLQDKILASFDSKFDLLSNKIALVIQQNNQLKSKIEQLESKLFIIERAQSILPSINQENLFSEFTDRQSRACNIMLFNVSDFSTHNSDQLSDATFIDEMFNIIGVSTTPMSVH